MKNKPECYVPERPIPEIYHGIPTFMGLPKIERKEDLPNYDVVFSGIPFEGVCTWGGFSGTELQPKTVRCASARYGGYLPEFDVDVFDTLTGGDYGDVATKNGDIEGTMKNIEAHAKELWDANVFPVTFGGDHSVAYPIMKALAEKHDGKIGIIHLDAHFDNMDHFGEHKFARCSPLRRTYELPGLDPKNIVHVGIRGPRNNPLGMQAAREVGATVISSFECKAPGGIERAIERSVEIASKGTKAVYVTFCSDALDVAHNPGGPADPCGLSTYEMACYLRGVASQANVCGFDFVEIYPPSDRNNVSSHVCCWMSLYVLSGLVLARNKK